jgi:hypothetical protein
LGGEDTVDVIVGGVSNVVRRVGHYSCAVHIFSNRQRKCGDLGLVEDACRCGACTDESR